MYRRKTSSSSSSSYGKKKLYYPRGASSGASWKSRAPYRINSATKPELKNSDNSLAPFPFSWGPPASQAIVPPYFAWTPTGVNTQWEAWSGTNTNSVVFGPVNQPVQGTGSYQRIGTRIKMKSLWFQFAVRNWTDPNADAAGSALTATPCMFRVMVVLDTQPNGNPLDLTTVLDPIVWNTAPGGGAAIGPQSPHSLDNRDRYKTLMDVRDSLNPGGDEMKCYEKFIKLNFLTQFSQAGAIITNALYFIFLSDANIFTNTADPPVTIDNRPFGKFSSRVRFEDP